ncbi:glycoside hydrolase family 3 protein, partial [Piromyces sp. E2]
MRLYQKLLAVCAVVAPMVSAFEVKTRLWSESEDLAKAFVAEMTLDEKINMVTGSGNSFGPCIGYVPPIERLGFKGLCLQDGPAGVRAAKHATTFPSGLNIASTFDQDIMKNIGVAIGEECRAKGVNVILGPAMNMYRSPAAGRNWEGYGEDTYLATVCAKNVVAGIQSQGVFATAKHFVGNEQEYKRDSSNSIIDERVLQEVYFPPFKAAVVSGAGAFMSGYNDLNGIPNANNTYLLKQVLKKQFKFHGFVMSDWWGTKDKYEITNGLDLNMPGGKQWGPTVTESVWGEELKAAVEDGEIDVSYLDEACERVMTMMYKYRQFDDFPELNLDADGTKGHTELVRKAAAASVVLLKNDEDILPLSGNKYKKIAIIGDGALPTKLCTDNGCTEGKMSGVVALGWGSGTTNMEDISDPLSALTERAEKDGITITSFTEDDSNTEKAAEVAADADLAIVVVTASSGEGYMNVEGNNGDRKDLDLWHNGNDLVAAVAAANKNTVVVIYSPGVVNLPFLDDIKGLVYAGMPGKEAGHGLADVLFNDVAPSGKLPFTWGKKREDYCCDVVYGNDKIIDVPYSEGFFLGYKWFDKEKIQPHFSFGHGLTYAKFKIHDDGQSYWNVQTQRLINLINGISTTFTIENTSDFGGYITPEVYLTMPTAEADPRIGVYPELNFKNFTKIYLEGGEKKKINLLVAYADTQYFNTTKNEWQETIDGTYKVHVGFSHDDI